MKQSSMNLMANTAVARCTPHAAWSLNFTQLCVGLTHNNDENIVHNDIPGGIKSNDLWYAKQSLSLREQTGGC